MFFKKSLFIFAVITLLVFLLLTYQSIKGKWHLSGIPSYPVRVISHGTSTVINKVMDFFHAYILITGIEEENRKLRERIGIYEQEKNRYIEAEYENIRLRGLLDLKSTGAVRVSAAEVFARDPVNWFQILWINKGSNDDIKRDMIAVTPAGIVGKIHNVYVNRSGIILITDVNSSVAVRIQTSRVDGILQGRGGGSCYLKYVQKNSNVRVGDKVITSGLDGLYPEGLLAGHVASVRSGDKYLFQEIEVEPAQNISQVEEVIILRR